MGMIEMVYIVAVFGAGVFVISLVAGLISYAFGSDDQNQTPK